MYEDDRFSILHRTLGQSVLEVFPVVSEPILQYTTHHSLYYVGSTHLLGSNGMACSRDRTGPEVPRLERSNFFFLGGAFLCQEVNKSVIIIKPFTWGSSFLSYANIQDPTNQSKTFEPRQMREDLFQQ